MPGTSHLKGAGVAGGASQFLAGDGSAAAPAYAFLSDPSTGFLRVSSGRVDFSSSGTRSATFSASNGFALRNSWFMGWVDTDDLATASAFDVKLVRDAAATLALKNGTTAQAFRVYGTTTGPQYISISHDGTHGYVNVVGGGTLYLNAGGANRWNINASGHLMAITDNTQDIGASGSTRPRTAYVGTSYVLGASHTRSLTAVNGAAQHNFTFSETLTGSPADWSGWLFTPTMAGAFTITRFNYLMCSQPAGAATITDACALAFDAAVGTHKALASPGAVAVTLGTGPTGANAGNPLGWIKINANGAKRFVPFW